MSTRSLFVLVLAMVLGIASSVRWYLEAETPPRELARPASSPAALAPRAEAPGAPGAWTRADTPGTQRRAPEVRSVPGAGPGFAGIRSVGGSPCVPQPPVLPAPIEASSPTATSLQPGNGGA